ncbi:GntR family transcriptional regulator [Clostridium sp. D33t1_170424_F3]|uniref:GntR family transcriptional regulator n=1 Tax=Clostridium sp. D33t1_170424_F3 TaxID=2787099 RepID=UPI002570E29F|nr:GntR family transcriptional regulator [Clostridium sp. D33t1_170424_F3]
MLFSLDYKSRLPIYEQLYKNITRMAALGAAEENEQLPSVRALAQELGVNPNTVQKAYQLLERDGIIYSVPGKGSFISENINALSQQKEIAAQKLRDAAKSALDCGMPREEAVRHVENVYEGRAFTEANETPLR